jgi:hypothetical protein
MASNVPASALSNFVNQWPASTLVIGDNYVPYSNPSNTPWFWYVAVDLTDLSINQNIVSNDPENVPPAIQALLGNTQYFLFFIANWQSSYNLPTGNLATFLQQVGSGPALANGEQAIEQLGTGTLLNFSYILAATFDDNDQVGFEAFSVTDYSVLTMQFMPVQVGGNTIYAPIRTP